MSHPPPPLEESLESTLERLLPTADATPAPLHRAMRDAVFPGGKRLRPILLLRVAEAGRDVPSADLALRAACAVELVHAASLVHDDLPCFDDAAVRRGMPAIHVTFGEATALLAGDALLARAFEVLADAPEHPARALRLVRLLGEAVGSTRGIIGGQALELAPEADGTFTAAAVEECHARKTGALFRFAAAAGALASGATEAEAEAWGRIGALVGTWAQLADDLLDLRATARGAGKPVRRDAALRRPNAGLGAGGEAAVRDRLEAIHRELEAGVTTLAAQPGPLLGLFEAMRRMLAALVGRAAA